MKWPFTSIVLAFACLSFASSAPLILDETAMMYPAYPYMPYDGLNFDVGKFFRKAANSVKHFYSYVNSWIFGKNNSQYWKGQQGGNDSQHPSGNLGRVHIEAYKVYKDADGHVVVKNIPNLANFNLPMSPNALNKLPIPQNPGFIGPIVLDGGFNALMQDPSKIVKKDNPNVGLEKAMQNIIMNNPFRWNEKLANDQMLGKSADRIIVHPLMVRLQGQIPLNGPFGAILDDQQLQNIIAQQMQNQQPQAQQKEEPKAETTVPPQTNEPAQKQDNEETKTPAAEEKQDDNDQADDDEEDSDDDQNDDAAKTNNDQTTVSEVPKNEQPTQPKEQPQNSENQANANAAQVQNGNNEPKPGQHPSGLDNIFVQGGNQDDVDTIRKVLAMVQPQNNANNQNDAFMNNFRW